VGYSSVMDCKFIDLFMWFGNWAIRLHDHELMQNITYGAYSLEANVEAELAARRSTLCMQVVHCSLSAHAAELQ
jgi:hypothetical protein